jgi:hypothetical protein
MPAYTKNDVRGTTAGRKDEVENNISKMGIANWRQIAQDSDGWREQLGMDLSFLDSGTKIKKRRIYIKKYLVSPYSSHILLYVNLIIYCM